MSPCVDPLAAPSAPLDGHFLRNRLAGERLLLTSTVALVPVAAVGPGARAALGDALALRADHTLAVHVRAKETLGCVRRLLHAWDELDTGVPLIVLDSDDEDVAGPVVAYLRRRHHRHAVTVLLADAASSEGRGGTWEGTLSHRHADRLELALAGEPNVRTRRCSPTT